MASQQSAINPRVTRARRRPLRQKQQDTLHFEAERLESRLLLAGVTVGNALDVTNAPDLSSISALVANDGGDGISLREAIIAANHTIGADTITFAAAVFNGEARDVIRLQLGQLAISEAVHIDGAAQDVVISGDASGDDVLVSATFITDIAASETAGVLIDNNGRIFNVIAPSVDKIKLTGLTVTGGNMNGRGGGIDSIDASLVIEKSSISGNRATSSGGGIFARGVTLTSSTVCGNSTTGPLAGGGGISARTVTLTNSTVSRNSSGDNGGGIKARGGNLTLTSSTVSGNNSAGYGAGIASTFGDVTLTSSTVNGNSTTRLSGKGGGIWAVYSDMTLTNSTVSRNTSDDDGGGIYTRNGAVTLTGSTVSGNTSGANGGGIYVRDSFENPQVTIQHSIVAGNMGSGSGPDLFLDPDSTLEIDFSLIGDNAGTTLAEAQTADSNGNLIGSTSGSGIIDPMLGSLADNGGPTLTHALLPGSLAIGAGDSLIVAGVGNTPLFDQRGAGFDRVRGRRIDIGAFEVQSDVLLLSSTTSGDVDGIQFSDEDIVAFDSYLGTWSMFFDGSDVGLRTRDIDAFHLLASGDILLSLNAPLNIDGMGQVDDSDILRFITVTTGDETSGTFELFFDGSDVGLTTGGEDIDAISVDASGGLIISTTGTVNVTGGLRAFDEDLLMFTATSFGVDTAGTWSLHFDGSDVGLQAGAEDLSGLIVDTNTGDLLLSTNGNFNIPGLTGQGGDVWHATPTSLGTDTQLGSVNLRFDASSITDFARERVDGISTLRGLLPTVPVTSDVSAGTATDLTMIDLKTDLDEVVSASDESMPALPRAAVRSQWTFVGRIGDSFGKWLANLDELE